MSNMNSVTSGAKTAFILTYHWMSNMNSVTSGARTAYPSGTHEST